MFQPCSSRLHQAPFAAGRSPLPCSRAGVSSSFPGQPGCTAPCRWAQPSLAKQGGPGARGLGCLSFPLCCSLRARRKVHSAPVSPQRGKTAGPSYAGTFGREKAKVAPSQLEGWKRNMGEGGQHFRLSDRLKRCTQESLINKWDFLTLNYLQFLKITLKSELILSIVTLQKKLILTNINDTQTFQKINPKPTENTSL